MYDGEDTQNFACLVGDHVVCGQFAGAEFLREGNRIKAVVSRHGAALVAPAILDEKQGYLWIGHAWGSAAERSANFKLALSLWVFAMICWNVAYLLLGGRDGYIDSMLFGAVGGGVICLVVAIWSNRDMRALSGHATEMFRLLGFLESDKVNMNNYRIQLVRSRDRRKINAPREKIDEKAQSQVRDVFCYKRAIEDGKLAMVAVE